MISEFDPYELKKLGVFPSEALAQAIDTMPIEALKRHMERMRPFQEMMRPFASLAERNNRIRELFTPLPRDSALSSLAKISAAAKAPWLKSLGTPIPRDSPFFHGAFAPIPARFRNWLSVPFGESSEEQERDIDGAQYSIDTAIKCTDAQVGALEKVPNVNDDAYHANTLQVIRSLRAVRVKLNIPASASDSEALLPYDVAIQVRISPQQLANVIKSSTQKLLLQAGDIIMNLREHGMQMTYNAITSSTFEKLQSRFHRMLPFVASEFFNPQACLAPFADICAEVGKMQFPPSLVGLNIIVGVILNVIGIINLFQKPSRQSTIKQ